MKRFVSLMLCAAMLASTTGCVFAKVKMPLDKDVSVTQLGAKVGKANAHTVLWLVAWGDASTAKAADNGRIKTINHLDAEVLFILFGVYSRRTTVAYGD